MRALGVSSAPFEAGRFVQRRRNARRKRIFDLAICLCLAPIWLPLGAALYVLVLLADGRPVFYRARRVGQGGRPFFAFKFRTMRAPGVCADAGVTGGDKSGRITRLGRVLRRYRLDELPQMINVIRAEMSLVGPRPPDPRYVAAFPQIYVPVLQSRPGLTGLSTLIMYRFEDRVLSQCDTPAATDEVYCRRAIPRKARLDMIYQRRESRPGLIWFDIWVIARSVATVLVN